MAAKLYAPTTELKKALEWSHTEDFKAQIKRQEKVLADLGKKYPIIRFPVADGYAQYAVLKMKPLSLMHIPYMDAWHADPILLRGLTAKDVQKRIDGDKMMDALFKKKAIETKQAEEELEAKIKAEKEAKKKTKVVKVGKIVVNIPGTLTAAQKAWVTRRAKQQQQA